jgi:glutathione S-transferase
MTRPEIIGSMRSTYTQAVCMVCEEKGIDYTRTEVMRDAPELRAIHPLGKMPVLRHGDLALFESAAIAGYLDRSFDGPKLFPSDPRRAALTDQWVSFVNTVIDRTFVRTYLYAYIATADGKPDRAAIDRVMPDVRAQLAVLDEAVAATGHLVDDVFTYADINLLPILDRLKLPPEGAQALAASPNVTAYLARHATRPSFQCTAPPPGQPRRAQPRS